MYFYPNTIKGLKEFEKACKAYEKKFNTKKKARKLLIELGIYNKDGTLHENYGGFPYIASLTTNQKKK